MNTQQTILRGAAALLMAGLLGSCSKSEQDEQSASIDCEKAVSTIEINQCMMQDLQTAEERLQVYLNAVREELKDDETTIKAFEQAQTAWVNYREAHCQSVFAMYRDGTISGTITLGCKLLLAEERTYAIWETFLTDADGSSSVLPEPDFGFDESGEAAPEVKE